MPTHPSGIVGVVKKCCPIMNALAQVLAELPGLDPALHEACHWLCEVAQVRTPDVEVARDRIRHRYGDWRGAIRGEFDLIQQQWWFFCPTWHTGQAVKALTKAYQIRPQESWLEAATRGAEFVTRHQVRSGTDAGLLLAYEDFPDKVTTSAILESLDGLLVLSDATGDERWAAHAIEALKWCAENAWVQGEGLIRDLYDPSKKAFVNDYVHLADLPGRPLIDDGVWLSAYQRTNDQVFLRIHEEILTRLLADENPAGNWVRYGPCMRDKGYIHPRHAYWWGRPMLAAWHASGDQRWLDVAWRAGEWCRRAQRIDGGMFRTTNLQSNTSSFGQATSGAMCAAILWLELYQASGDERWLEPIHRALEYGCRMQFLKPDNPQLKGALIEGCLEPDGTDRCPYFIRDLATIFFVQAASDLIRAVDTRGKTHPAKRYVPAAYPDPRQAAIRKGSNA